MAKRGRARVRHVQQELFRHGGKRKGAGRPPNGKRAGSPHTKRETLKPRFPVHVTLRVGPEIPKLRRRDAYKAVRWATIAVAKRGEKLGGQGGEFRIVHVSLQGTHVHLLVEAENKTALARGMQSFEISAAKLINATIRTATGERRRGQVFADRYHQEIIRTPRQARHALSYVLNNWRKHGDDRKGVARTWKVDPFSTGVLFGGWKELAESQFRYKWRETYEPMVVWLPRTWLLAEGWQRYGLIRTDEVPSARRSAVRA